MNYVYARAKILSHAFKNPVAAKTADEVKMSKMFETLQDNV